MLKGFQPRYALYVNFFTVLKSLHNLNLIPDQNQIVQKTISLLKKKGELYSSPVNPAIELAETLVGYVPVIYAAADFTSAAATRLKGQFNENAKQHAFYNNLPELDHNEIMGWEGYNQNLKFKVINIFDEGYHPQVKKRFDVTSQVITKCGGEIINLSSSEENVKLRLLDLIYLGDWATYYLAVIRGYSPTAIDNINYLKAHLSDPE